jgi:single-stranded DNA-binding protein
VVAFSESAGAALLALSEGDSLAIGGTLKPGAWTDREGNARPQLDMVAAQVMTLYALKRRRDAAQAGDEPGDHSWQFRPESHSRTQRQPPRPGIRPPADWDTGRDLADILDDLP